MLNPCDPIPFPSLCVTMYTFIQPDVIKIATMCLHCVSPVQRPYWFRAIPMESVNIVHYQYHCYFSNCLVRENNTSTSSYQAHKCMLHCISTCAHYIKLLSTLLSVCVCWRFPQVNSVLMLLMKFESYVFLRFCLKYTQLRMNLVRVISSF